MPNDYYYVLPSTAPVSPKAGDPKPRRPAGSRRSTYQIIYIYIYTCIYIHKNNSISYHIILYVLSYNLLAPRPRRRRGPRHRES